MSLYSWAIFIAVFSQKCKFPVFQNVVRYYRIPILVFYDRNPRFTGGCWYFLWKLLGLYVIETSAHQTQADGQTRCMNHTIGQIFLKVCWVKTKSTGLTMWQSLKWLSIPLSMLALTKPCLKSFMVKIFHCLFICYCP